MSTTRGSTGWPSSSAPSFRRSDMRSSGKLDERQRLRRPQMNGIARLCAERLAVEDQVRAFPMDRDLVDLLEVDAAHLLALVAAGEPGKHRAEDRPGALFDCDDLHGPAFRAPE